MTDTPTVLDSQFVGGAGNSVKQCLALSVQRRWTRFVTKGMKRREVETALKVQDCRPLRNRGGHEVWGCPCGRHAFALPNHTVTSPGVVRKAIATLTCLPRGWLQ